jgi:hypothetical protein
MAVSSATAWTSDVEITASTGPCRLTAVEATVGAAAANTVYIQLWNNADPNPATTAADMVLPLPVAPTGDRVKFVFPGGGIRFGTALTWLVTTTATGETAPTTDAPQIVNVYYALGG